MSAAVDLVDALCERLEDARGRLERSDPEGAARALTGMDRLIEAAVEAAPTPGELQRVRAALGLLERIAAETSAVLHRCLVQGWAGARAARAYGGG